MPTRREVITFQRFTHKIGLRSGSCEGASRQSSSLRQFVIAVPKPLQAHGKADALFGREEDDEGGGLT